MLRSFAHQVVRVALVVMLVGTARAQSIADAERLFEDGRMLLAAGRIAEACAAFDASYRADANLSTLVNLASCRKQNGQLATAWGHFVTATHQAAGRTDRAKLLARAAAEAAELEQRLSTLTLRVPAASRIEGLVVTRDGTTVDPGTWDRVLPVDGGTYRIAATAPGHAPWSTSIDVRGERDHGVVDIPRLAEIESVPASATPRVTRRIDDRAPTGIRVASPASAWRRPAAIAGVATGGALLLGAGLLDASARGQNEASLAAMDDARRASLHSSAVTRRYAAQAIGGVGIVCVATGVVLWLQSRSHTRQVVPTASASSVGLGIAGTF